MPRPVARAFLPRDLAPPFGVSIAIAAFSLSGTFNLVTLPPITAVVCSNRCSFVAFSSTTARCLVFTPF